MNIREILGGKRLSSQRGLTLVEMLIAMFIFSMILIGTLLLIKYIYKNYGYAMEQGLSLNEVQKGIKVLTDDIRGTRSADSGAYAVVGADKFDFVFYNDVDNDKITERVHYYLQDASIKRGIAEPSGTPPSYPGGDQTTTTLVTHVVNTADQPLFYFYDMNYPADQTNNPIAIPVSDVSKIRLVKIDMFYNLNPFRAPDNIRLESFVEMRNLKDNW
jgi:prepilin-type N-terminal cleavage/methylation domain-containing protein